ncbi:MAG: uroporphyrinogen-III C-methyltransferase [Pseudomonadales bacterium]
MDNKDNTPSNTQTSSGQSEVADKSTIKPQPKNFPSGKRVSIRKWRLWIFFIACLLLFLSVLSVGGWFIYQLQQQQAEIQTTLKNNQIYIKGLRGEIKDEQRKYQEKSIRFTSALEDIESQVAAYARRLNETSFAPRYMGLLTEAEYLTRLARHRLDTEKNSKNAVELLVSADLVLRDLEVREAIAKSIAKLRSFPTIDREGLYTQLGALSDQLVELPMINYPIEVTQASTINISTTSAPEGWQEMLIYSFDSALASLAGLVRIQELDVPLSPMPSADESRYLRYSLAILLEHAQVALLREEETIYRESLQKASKQLSQYAKLNQLALPYLEQLSRLEGENIIQKFPDISPELKILKDYIDGQLFSGQPKSAAVESQ